MSVSPLIGEIQFWANSFAMPRNWLPCDGKSYETFGKYANLHLVIGEHYGGGNGTFKVPDLRHHTPIGAGHGAGLSSYQIGQKGGAASVEQTIELLPSHDHTIDFSDPQGINMPASTDVATSDAPISEGYLANGNMKIGLSAGALNLYKENPEPASLVTLGALNATAKGALQGAGQTTPEPRENQQPFITYGFYIAWREG